MPKEHFKGFRDIENAEKYPFFYIFGQKNDKNQTSAVKAHTGVIRVVITRHFHILRTFESVSVF